MTQVMLENIKPGMVIAKDVLDRNGRLILHAGTEITASHLRTFKVWRITSVFIHETTSEETGTAEDFIDPVRKKRLETKYKQLFKNADLSHPFIQHLYHFCLHKSMRAQIHLEENP